MMQNSIIEVAVINVVNKTKKSSMNKDLNGGFGVADISLDSWPEKIISLIKRESIRLPILSLAFLMGIFKQRNISAKYYDGVLPSAEHEIILIYGSIVDYKNENFICDLLKKKFKGSKVGFIGSFPSTKPELFETGDFVIVGDFEYFFLKEYKNKYQLNGRVLVKEKIDMNELPHPEIGSFPIKKYNYFPGIIKKPFFTLQCTRGCPYSCSYYCVYGQIQGNKIIARSPKNVVEDMVYLRDRYGVKGLQFRDPCFGAKEGYIEELCREIERRNLLIQWGIETRIDLLDEGKIKMMFDVGLRYIEVGIETSDPEIAKQNRRLIIDFKHQGSIIKYCERLGIKISALYLFGFKGDTKKTMEATLIYAKQLNTFLARFAVCTPYPGTPFFEDLEKQARILTYDYEKYTQFNLVSKQQGITEEDVQCLLSRAYKEYYFRPRYISKLLKWKIREFWL